MYDHVQMVERNNTLKPKEFEWDAFNRDKNKCKHKVDYQECEEIFGNRPLKTYKDIKHSQDEDRFTALGITNNSRFLYLVFTIRSKKIRIVSARDMSRKERIFYETK